MLRSFLFLLFCGLTNCCEQSPTVPLSVGIGITGDPADVQTSTQSGILLMGGSTDVDEALKWMIERSGGGDFVIIRASGSTGYNDYIKELGNINSVETLLIDSREKANLAETRDKIRNAEALFIAGGDQRSYVKYWTGTEVSEAIKYLIDIKNVPIGGTSAGCAVLSGYAFDAKTGGANSKDVLANPYDSQVSISRSFIFLNVLKNVIADQHYSQRSRQGRHVVFMARIIKDFGGSSLMGIGVDEKTAVAVDDDGTTKVFGSSNAYFILSETSPEQCEEGKKLIWNQNGKALKVYVRKGSATGNPGINLLTKSPLPPDQYWSVLNGELVIK